MEGLEEKYKSLTEEVRRKDKDSKKIKEKLFEMETKEYLNDSQHKSLTQLIHKLKLQSEKLKVFET
jgi:hypothetical protein